VKQQNFCLFIFFLRSQILWTKVWVLSNKVGVESRITDKISLKSDFNSSWCVSSTLARSCSTALQASSNSSKLLGAVHERRSHKIAKNWPPLPCQKCPHWLTSSPPSYLCGHGVNFEKFLSFCT